MRWNHFESMRAACVRRWNKCALSRLRRKLIVYRRARWFGYQLKIRLRRTYAKRPQSKLTSKWFDNLYFVRLALVRSSLDLASILIGLFVYLVNSVFCMISIEFATMKMWMETSSQIAQNPPVYTESSMIWCGHMSFDGALCCRTSHSHSICQKLHLSMDAVRGLHNSTNNNVD